jgi:hypothetical protein
MWLAVCVRGVDVADIWRPHFASGTAVGWPVIVLSSFPRSRSRLCRVGLILRWRLSVVPLWPFLSPCGLAALRGGCRAFDRAGSRYHFDVREGGWDAREAGGGQNVRGCTERCDVVVIEGRGV